MGCAASIGENRRSDGAAVLVCVRRLWRAAATAARIGIDCCAGPDSLGAGLRPAAAAAGRLSAAAAARIRCPAAAPGSTRALRPSGASSAGRSRIRQAAAYRGACAAARRGTIWRGAARRPSGHRRGVAGRRTKQNSSRWTSNQARCTGTSTIERGCKPGAGASYAFKHGACSGQIGGPAATGNESSAGNREAREAGTAVAHDGSSTCNRQAGATTCSANKCGTRNSQTGGPAAVTSACRAETGNGEACTTAASAASVIIACFRREQAGMPARQDAGRGEWPSDLQIGPRGAAATMSGARALSACDRRAVSPIGRGSGLATGRAPT